jgi:hypothetical protein
LIHDKQPANLKPISGRVYHETGERGWWGKHWYIEITYEDGSIWNAWEWHQQQYGDDLELYEPTLEQIMERFNQIIPRVNNGCIAKYDFTVGRYK